MLFGKPERGGPDGAQFGWRGIDMADVPRINPADVMEKRRAGQSPWLVCAYDDEAKCRSLRLKGSLTLGEFAQKLRTLPRDEEIVFYCA